MRGFPTALFLALVLGLPPTACESEPPGTQDDGAAEATDDADGGTEADGDAEAETEVVVETDADGGGDADAEDAPEDVADGDADVPPACEPLATDYLPRDAGSATDDWPACISDDNTYHWIGATIGSIARVAATIDRM